MALGLEGVGRKPPKMQGIVELRAQVGEGRMKVEGEDETPGAFAGAGCERA